MLQKLVSPVYGLFQPFPGAPKMYPTLGLRQYAIPRSRGRDHEVGLSDVLYDILRH